jgi:hypothetical protein
MPPPFDPSRREAGKLIFVKKFSQSEKESIDFVGGGENLPS